MNHVPLQLFSISQLSPLAWVGWHWKKRTLKMVLPMTGIYEQTLSREQRRKIYFIFCQIISLAGTLSTEGLVVSFASMRNFGIEESNLNEMLCFEDSVPLFARKPRKFSVHLLRNPDVIISCDNLQRSHPDIISFPHGAMLAFPLGM